MEFPNECGNKSVSLFLRYSVLAWLSTNIDQLLLSTPQPPGLIADICVWKENVLLSKYSLHYPLFILYLASGLTPIGNVKIFPRRHSEVLGGAH